MVPGRGTNKERAISGSLTVARDRMSDRGVLSRDWLIGQLYAESTAYSKMLGFESIMKHNEAQNVCQDLEE
jgi:hypothetical protein